MRAHGVREISLPSGIPRTVDNKHITNTTMRNMTRGTCTTGIGAVFLSVSLACEPAQEPSSSTSPQGATVYIISPIDGAVVSDTFIVRFGLRGMGVAPAGTAVANTGHHHLLMDTEILPPLDQPLLDQVQHFGLGQTEASIMLEPGEHTLQLILGDKFHTPHDPPVVGEPITITVQ